MSQSQLEPCWDETPTTTSLSEQIEELSGTVSALLQYISDQFNASRCEHCGHLNPRKNMLAVFGMDNGTDGKPHPESSRWFCGYCVYAACVSRGANRQEYRDRIGQWFAFGYGRKFLEMMDSHYKHLGPGANRAPVAEQLRIEFSAEIRKAARRIP